MTRLVRLSLRARMNCENVSLLLPKTCSPLPSNLDKSRFPLLQGLDFAGTNIVYGGHPKIDILIIGSGLLF